MIYLGSPGSQMHAHLVKDMPVLLSYGIWMKWWKNYQASFGPLLIDSGAFSVINSGKTIDVEEYVDWAEQWRGRADAVACLDDISGDWEQGWRNMERHPPGIGFPTFHDKDPWGLLPELCEAARDHGGWIGIGMTPTERPKLGDWLARVLDQIPDDLHVHGWALGHHWRTHLRLDSMDSTNWFRDSWKFNKQMPWLTPAECVELVVKRSNRLRREPTDKCMDAPKSWGIDE